MGGHNPRSATRALRALVFLQPDLRTRLTRAISKGRTGDVRGFMDDDEPEPESEEEAILILEEKLAEIKTRLGKG